MDVLDEEKINIIQEFTALMYGVKRITNVNDARYYLFQQKYAATKTTDFFFKNITTFDSKLIPPCWKSLKEKMLRTIFVNSMWTKATDPCCVNLNPENCGWNLIKGALKPTWFIGDPTPMTVEEILSESNGNNFEDKEVTDESDTSKENIDDIDTILDDEEEVDDEYEEQRTEEDED